MRCFFTSTYSYTPRFEASRVASLSSPICPNCPRRPGMPSSRDPGLGLLQPFHCRNRSFTIVQATCHFFKRIKGGIKEGVLTLVIAYRLFDLTIDSQQICDRFPIDSRRCSSRLPLLPLHHCFTRPYLSQFHHCYKLLATRLSAAPLLLSIYKNRLQLGSDLF